jgi:hypothetical protein
MALSQLIIPIVGEFARSKIRGETHDAAESVSDAVGKSLRKEVYATSLRLFAAAVLSSLVIYSLVSLLSYLKSVVEVQQNGLLISGFAFLALAALCSLGVIKLLRIDVKTQDIGLKSNGKTETVLDALPQVGSAVSQFVTGFSSAYSEKKTRAYVAEYAQESIAP